MTISVTRQVVELEYKSAAELREIYNNLFPNSAANCNSGKEHLIHKIAYRLQELAYGGLDESTKAALEEAAEGKNVFSRLKSNLVIGTQISREHNGVVHEVEVIKDGFEYNGKKWNSLSAIATKITGTRWNGPRFFGLRG